MSNNLHVNGDIDPHSFSYAHSFGVDELQKPVAGTERVLYLLSVLADYGKPLTVLMLADLTGLAVSTLYRHLALLKNWGFVQEIDKTYMLGPKCLQLALGFDQSSWLVREALPEIRDLSSKTNETVGLMVAVHDKVVCLDMIESRHSLRCAFVKGKGLSLLHGASAKALLAYLPVKQRMRILDTTLSNSLIDKNLLEQEIAQIQMQGFATSTGEVDEGVWGISVPVFHMYNKLLGAVTLMAPVTRIVERKNKLIKLTCDYVKRIELRLRSLN